MALLDALSILVARHPIVLSAIHVHHGLSPNADCWAEFCAEQCAARGVSLSVHRLQLARKPGQSLEAIARSARYERLLATDVDIIALGHQCDDQAETLLLQLMRGAGPHGLAAMPAYRPGRPALIRPLLNLSRATIAAYVRSRTLSWIDDESNANPAHKRNVLRTEVAPRLRAYFPGYPKTLERAARHQAEAARLLDELAALDAAGAIDRHALLRERLGVLSPPRARNLLRWFLRHEGLRPPSEAGLADMLQQLLDASDDAQVRIACHRHEIGVYRGHIRIHAPTAAAFGLPWSGERELHLPGGTLLFELTRGDGLSADKLAQAPVTLRSRVGGERIQLAANRPHHEVKKLMQQAGLPAWERRTLPLVWCGGALAAVPGIGVDVAFRATPAADAWRLTWMPDSRSK